MLLALTCGPISLAFAGDCYSGLCQTYNVQQFKVQKVQAHYVAPIYYAPLSNYDQQRQSFASDTEILKDAIRQGVLEALREHDGKQQIGSGMVAKYCSKCHQSGGSNGAALDAFAFDSPQLSAPQAVKAQAGLLFAGMAEKSGIASNPADFKSLLEEFTIAMNTATIDPIPLTIP